MAAPVSTGERRTAPRRSAASYGLEARAQLRPGVTVVVINLSSCGALLESAAPCRPGGRTELHLDSPDGRKRAAIAQVLRCAVVSIRPLRFRTAIGFAGATDFYDPR